MNKTITYRFEVKASFALTDDPTSPNFYTEAVATSPEFRRQLEKTMFHLLKRFEAGDVDVELMDFTVEDEDYPHGASCDCETCQMERAADTADEVRHD